MEEILKLSTIKPELFEKNKYIKRNEGGYVRRSKDMEASQKSNTRWEYVIIKKARKCSCRESGRHIIRKQKGCKVWTLERKELIDVSIMGIGTNILGYGNSEVDQEVLNTVNTGNMCTLNCIEEVHSLLKN